MRKQNFEPLKMNLQLFAEEPKDEPSDGKTGNEPKDESKQQLLTEDQVLSNIIPAAETSNKNNDNLSIDDILASIPTENDETNNTHEVPDIFADNSFSALSVNVFMLAIASAFISSEISELLIISSNEASFFERICSRFNLADALNAPAEDELVRTASPTLPPSGVSV